MNSPAPDSITPASPVAEPSTLDHLEAAILAATAAGTAVRQHCPVIHRFTPGMYIREIHIPAGTLGTTMEHLTRHPFFILRGHVFISSGPEGHARYRAPHVGITEAGTRRALYAVEDTIWVTCHATDETDIEKIGQTITTHRNPILHDVPPSLEMWRDSLPIKLPTD